MFQARTLSSWRNFRVNKTFKCALKNFLAVALPRTSLDVNLEDHASVFVSTTYLQCSVDHDFALSDIFAGHHDEVSVPYCTATTMATDELSRTHISSHCHHWRPLVRFDNPCLSLPKLQDVKASRRITSSRSSSSPSTFSVRRVCIVRNRRCLMAES